MVENGIKLVVSGGEHTFFVDNFSVGKARERVFSPYLSTSPFHSIHTATSSIYPQPLNQPTAQQTSAPHVQPS